MTKLLTKFASVLASLALVLTMVPASAFADDGSLAPSDPGTPVVLTDPAPVDPSTVTPTDPTTDTSGASLAPTSLAPAILVPAVATSTSINTQAEFDAAMADNNITTIEIASDFTVTSTLNITRAITVHGNGHTITVTNAVTGSAVLITGSNVTVSNLIVDSAGKIAKGLPDGIQGIQAYKASNITLDHVTSKNAGKSGIMVNGSTVTVNNVSTSGNFWDGINVDQGVGVTSPAILTVQGTSSHTEASVLNPSILIDNTSKGSVSGALDQYNVSDFGPKREYNLDPNFASIPACSTDDHTFDTFSLGSVNGQHGWTSTGPYDQAIVKNTYGFATFGCKSLRISNAVTSGSFGDQTFSYSTPNEAGETVAATSTFSGGTRQNHFDAQFDIASAASTTVQTGLALSVSPDRGDGSRMSYLRFVDSANGINVFFDDVQGTTTRAATVAVPAPAQANFVETQIAGGTASTSALSRTVPHTIRFSMDFVDGPGNDVVKVYIDGVLVKTGTSWEDYYRYDPEQSGNGNKVPTVDSLLFRAAGNAAPANSGKGFLFDNVNISTSATPTTTPGGSGNGNGNDGNGRGFSGGGGGGGGGGNGNGNNGGGNNNGGNGNGNGNGNGGQVLGAATFNFTRDLHIGMRGADVKELQTELIAAGYSIPAGATGYFGPQTRAAVAKWQADNNISPAAGYFGPISRAKYAADGSFHAAPAHQYP